MIVYVTDRQSDQGFMHFILPLKEHAAKLKTPLAALLAKGGYLMDTCTSTSLASRLNSP